MKRSCAAGRRPLPTPVQNLSSQGIAGCNRRSKADNKPLISSSPSLPFKEVWQGGCILAVALRFRNLLESEPVTVKRDFFPKECYLHWKYPEKVKAMKYSFSVVEGPQQAAEAGVGEESGERACSETLELPRRCGNSEIDVLLNSSFKGCLSHPLTRAFP